MSISHSYPPSPVESIPLTESKQEVRFTVTKGSAVGGYAELANRLFSVEDNRVVAFVGSGESERVAHLLESLSSHMAANGWPATVLNRDLKMLSFHGGSSLADAECSSILGKSNLRQPRPRAGDLFHDLRGTPFRTLVNCGSIREAAPLLAIAPETDGVVFLTGAGKTTLEELSRVVRLVEEAHSRLLGCILDGRSYALPNFIYRRWFQ